MSTLAAHPDPLLTGDLLAHLDAQLSSVARLLQLVLAQGVAIRSRDVDAVVRHVAAFQAELERRARIEEDRTRLLLRAGAALGIAPGAVTLTQLTACMTPADGDLAQARSAELQGLLAELAREHAANQALMRQELAFLDHLLRLVDPSAPAPAYGHLVRPALSPPRGDIRALDLRA
ncbi:MAG: flagellar export chaperone FlgN [Conexibacter sp.]